MMMHTPIFGLVARFRRSRWPLVSFCLWLALIAALFAFLWTYESTAGSSGDPSATWPDAAIGKPSKSQALLMFAHPRCPCTRASLRELAVVLSRRSQLESVTIIFFCPKDPASDWTDSPLVRQARSMTGVEVGFDEEGVWTRTFGVATSGHVLLYDADERLLFSGGITAFRNHEGANAGREAVLTLSQGQPSAVKETPIFGCPLFERAACPGENCEVRR